MSRKLRISTSLVLLGLFSGAAQASAADASDPRRYEVMTPRSDIKAGAAHAEVHAPLQVVRDAVTNYEAYGDYIHRFEKAKVVGRHGEAADVYLQVPILKGASKVWAVLHFDAAKPSANGDDVVVVGRMLQGNVKRLDARWHLSKIDDQNTNLDLELLIVPDWIVPVPNSLVTREASNAASKAVKGLRSASEQHAH